MAKQFDKIVIPVELQVKNEGVAEKIQKEFQNAQKIANKDGGIIFKMDIDKKGLVNVQQQIANFNKNSKNSVILNIDEAASLKLVENLKGKVLTEFTDLFNQIRNIANNGNNIDLTSGLKQQLNDVNSIKEKIKQTRKDISDFDKTKLKDTYKSYVRNKDTSSADELKKLKAEYMAAYENYYKSGNYDNNFSFQFEKATISLKELMKMYSGFQKELRNDESFSSASKSLTEEKNKLLQEKSKLESQLKNSGDGTKVDVTPKNVEEFVQQIESQARPAKINIEPTNIESFVGEIEKHQVKLGVELDDRSKMSSKELLSSYKNKLDYYSKQDPKYQYDKLHSIVSDFKRGNISSESFIDVNAITESLKKLGNFNLGRFLNNNGIKNGKGYEEFIAKYRSVKNEIESTKIELNVDDNSILSIKQDIQTKINPIEIDLKLKDGIAEKIGNTLKENINQSLQDVGQTVGENVKQSLKLLNGTSDKGLKSIYNGGNVINGRKDNSSILSSADELLSKFSKNGVVDQRVAQLLSLVNTQYSRDSKNGNVTNALAPFEESIKKYGLSVEEVSNVLQSVADRLKVDFGDKKYNTQTQVDLESDKGEIQELAKQIESQIPPVEVPLNIDREELQNIINTIKELETINASNPKQGSSLKKEYSRKSEDVINKLSNDELSKGKVIGIKGKLTNALNEGGYKTAIDFLNQRFETNIPYELEQINTGLQETQAQANATSESLDKLSTINNVNNKKIQTTTSQQESQGGQGGNGGGNNNFNLTSNIAEIKAEIEKLKAEKIDINVKYISNKEEIDKEITDIKGIEIPPIDINITGIEKLTSDTETSQSISSLAKDISSIGSAWDTSNANVESASQKQVASINNIKKAVQELSTMMKDIGVTNVKNVVDIDKQLAQVEKAKEKSIKEIEKKQQALDKRQEKLENSIAKKQQSLDKKQEKLENSIAKKQQQLAEKEEKLKQQQAILKAQAEEKPSYAENMQNRDNVLQAARNSGYKVNEKNVSFDTKGVMTFTATIKEAGDQATKAKIKVEDFDKAVTKTGKLSPILLKENVVKQWTEQLNPDEIKKKFSNLAKEAGLSYDEGSLRVSQEGIITYTNTIEKNGKVIDVYRQKINSLNDVLTKQDKLNKNFVKQSNSNIGALSNTDRTQLDSKIAELRSVSKKISTLESRDAAKDADSEVYKRIIDLKNQQAQIENEINASLDEQKYKYSEIESILKRVSSAKDSEFTAYELTDKQNADIKEKYDEALKKLDKSNFNVGEILTNTDGSTITVGEKIDQVEAKIKDYYSTLSSGATINETETRNLNQALKEQYNIINELYNSNYAKVNDKGVLEQAVFPFNKELKNYDHKEIQKELERLYKKQGYDKVNFGKFNLDEGTFKLDLIKGNKIQSATATLSQLGEGAEKAGYSIRTLKGVEDDYISSGQKWINGFRAKINNLTQYVTGIELVMRTWNQIQQGFQFVKELDSSLTTINQTMSVTRDELSQLGNASIDSARNLGSTATDVLDAVAIYANANETAESILEKAQPTVMLANASGADTATAADQVQGVVQQFKELEGQERRVVNSYEKISSGLAIDFAKILARRLEIIY